MGYYPIKCVHCMRSVAMDERCVKMVPEEVKTLIQDSTDHSR